MLDLTPSLDPEPLCDACGSDLKVLYHIRTRSDATGEKRQLSLCQPCLGELIVLALVVAAYQREGQTPPPRPEFVVSQEGRHGKHVH